VFTESLTVRILGDSSGLQRELETVADGLDNLHSRLADASDAGRQVGEGLGRAATAITPLQQVSSVLQQIGLEARQISQIPISLNVQPAMAALAQLSAMIQAVAMQLQSLGGGFGIPGGGVPGGELPMRMPVPGFAEGGFVMGPSGVDQIPAWLTAGEFVLSRASTQRLGTTFLNALNSGPPAATRTSATHTGPEPVTSTTNNFGGITIEVTEAVEINDIVRDLRLQGAALRNRRG